MATETHTIHRDRTETEHGERRWGWWCDECEEGDYLDSPHDRDDAANAHAVS